MVKKTITVELEVWQELTKLKAELNLESLNNVIRILLQKWKDKCHSSLPLKE